MKSVLLILGFLLAQLFATAQRECSFTTYKEAAFGRSTELAARAAAVETFTQKWLDRKKAISSDHSGEEELITIPVVVHIVYHTPAQNISDAQIQSQLAVLNNDYNRENADSINTPSFFKPFAADCRIRFALAHVDPQGHPTNGIIRQQSNRISFTTDDAVKLSGSGGDDAWDADRYLNIWVANLSDGILGYASIPGGQKEKDGVVVMYTAFGTTGTCAAPFNRGRTATHEIGHWLNLIHTWGDADCGDDHVADTPPQKGPNRSCPGAVNKTCGNGAFGDMYMNYMDFTNDACMNMFTLGQRDRMRAQFAEGGPRYALREANASFAITGMPTVVTQVIMGDDGDALRLYPNPAAQSVTIRSNATAEAPVLLNVFTPTGQRLMMIQLVQPQQQVNVSMLKTGLYFLRSTDGHAYSARLVKL